MPIVEGGFDIDLPRMVKIRQNFRSDKIDDIPAVINKELDREEIKARFKPGGQIAVAVGSRGIANIFDIVKATVNKLKSMGTHPFIVPAMGSHGGATAEGQLEVLASYNITEETMGCPIRSSMETVFTGTSELGVETYIDKHAFESDGIVVINRVKVHTDFRGDVESGLMKMMAIGLGKHKGATAIHKLGFHTFGKLIPDMGRTILSRAPVACGLAIVENGYEQPMIIQAVLPEDFEATEIELLKVSKEAMAKLLFQEIHVLLIDEIGKNISGSGMDPNVTGRFVPAFLAKMDHEPKTHKIVVRDLTEETHGNATGIGMADVTTRRLVDKINFEYTYANVITSTELAGGKVPVTVDNDRQALVVALVTVNGVKPTEAKVVHIKNTLELGEIWISEALLPEAKANPQIEILSDPVPFVFDEEDNLLPYKLD
ncbi:MAG: lactate racemase domain-containing protein [Limnochordia bacterium]|jgi:hypothetical protein